MNQVKNIVKASALVMSLLMAGGLSACSSLVAQAQSNNPSAEPMTSLLKELSTYQAEEKTTAERIKTFDTLDFDVFTNQKWDRLHESHSDDITVHWPDGHTTKGIDVHIQDLKAMFVFAPDTRIQTHPVKFGKGEWTAVIGEMEGTFTKPMPQANGSAIQPTGKAFKISMATIGRWKDGKMTEEYLFWDNATYMNQLGLGQ